MIQKHVKELTEGMQSLCAIANKVVASEGRVEAIERDLLLDALRRLYDTVLQLEVRGTSAPAKPAEPEHKEENEAMPDAAQASAAVSIMPATTCCHAGVSDLRSMTLAIRATAMPMAANVA